MTSRISYKVTGTVQGVNFRSATVKKAESLGVTGFVKNASDGSVTGEAQGDESSLKQFTDYLHKGPSLARVSDVKQEQIPARDQESGFSQK